MVHIANHPGMNNRPEQAAILRRQSHPIITNLQSTRLLPSCIGHPFVKTPENCSGNCVLRIVHLPLNIRRPQVRVRVSPYGICGGQGGNGICCSRKFFGFILSVSFHLGSTFSMSSCKQNDRSCFVNGKELIE
jgi:hypothetical protein